MPVAGLGSRSLAWLIDAFIKSLALTALAVVLELLGEVGGGLLLISMFALFWLYNVLFEVLYHGATPGKRVLGLRVLNANGTPVGWRGSMIRNLIRFVDAFPGTYAVGCVAVLLNENFQRLGDSAAGTVVVYDVRQESRSAIEGAEPVELRTVLSLDEQQAIVSFGVRANRLNSQRAEELASLLEPVIANVDSSRLAGHASWLMSGRSSS